MKKISEMDLGELQDYALKLEGEKSALKDQLEESEKNYKDLQETNLLLQKRNNELFIRVEQGTRTDPGEVTPAEPETCEEYALKNIKNIMRG